jgi:serine/threonine protein kinase
VDDLEEETYTTAIDLWALGCIIYRIVTGAVPFPTLPSLRKYCKDPSKLKLNMPPTMEDAGKFVLELLTPHPTMRPSASAALESN